MASRYRIGSIVSADITLDDADALKDFYSQVIGWDTQALTMSDGAGEYQDYIVKDDAGNWVGGVCHARGMNAGIPASSDCAVWASGPSPVIPSATAQATR
ncbi:MAG TPA: hypothetical protein VKZ96_12795 [Thermomicrobiales bacterium]|nr:hypothetical protein [Thermomicrobiales bacterium]